MCEHTTIRLTETTEIITRFKNGLEVNKKRYTRRQYECEDCMMLLADNWGHSHCPS